MKAPKEFTRWWNEEGAGYAFRSGPKFAAHVAWSNGAYLARGHQLPFDYRTMKKAAPDTPGLWAYRIAGASESINVAISRGNTGELHMFHPNGSIYRVQRWCELYPKTRWHRIS